MPAQYLVIFAQAHHEFRIPELLSVAELNGFTVTLPSEEDCNISQPFTIIGLDKEEHARLLCRRCILIKSIYEFYAQGSSYEELHDQNRQNKSRWSRYVADTTFKFLVTAYKHRIPQTYQREVMESFDYMDFKGRIDMKDPEIILGCFEEYEDLAENIRGTHQGDQWPRFRRAYFGRLVENGCARSLITVFDVKKRVYFGNTSMEAEISLVMANQALAGPGKLIYDPFIGTGSMAYPVAYFGAQVFGSDIDGRQMRGKGNLPGIIRAAAQYGVSSRIIDLCTFDITKNPWRCGELFDAIITDPPYGVRAGAKRLGRRRELSPKRKAAQLEHLAQPHADDQPYIPPTKPYELSNLVSDLVLLSRYMLKSGGRLVFFLPTVNEEYEEMDIDSVLCEGMQVIANSLQDFGSWGRRLITIRKTAGGGYSPPHFEAAEPRTETENRTPAHKDFRIKYFQGFKKDAGQNGRAEGPN